MIMKPSQIARGLLKLSAEDFPRLAAERFGPHTDLDQTWQVFRPVATTLVDSFYDTLDLRDPEKVAEHLDRLPPELRGIGYEGAGMGLAALDAVSPRGHRLVRFVHGPGAAYQCLVYIGAGLVLPRLPGNPMRFVHAHPPQVRWFILDGYGFYDGFFAWGRAVINQVRPRQLTGYGPKAYDQGIGRSLWFSSGADVGRIQATISTFPESRRADLWSGIGLACAYAAGVLDRQAILDLVAASGRHCQHLAVGAAIASILREQSGQPAPHSDLACEVIWGAGADDVARTAHRAAAALSRDGVPHPHPHTYPRWRDQIAAAWWDTRFEGARSA